MAQSEQRGLKAWLVLPVVGYVLLAVAVLAGCLFILRQIVWFFSQF